MEPVFLFNRISVCLYWLYYWNYNNCLQVSANIQVPWRWEKFFVANQLLTTQGLYSMKGKLKGFAPLDEDQVFQHPPPSLLMDLIFCFPASWIFSTLGDCLVGLMDSVRDGPMSWLFKPLSYTWLSSGFFT